MRRVISLLAILLLFSGLYGGVEFQKYFGDASMRIDYYHMADKESELFSLDAVYFQAGLSCNPHGLLDPFNTGRYFIHVYDKEEKQLIWSRGFDSYCGEYMTTDDAGRGIKRTYHESAVLPYPRAPIRFVILRKDKNNVYREVFSQEIDPASPWIIREAPDPRVKAVEVLKNGDPRYKADLAILGEGYTEAEFGKFKADLERMTARLFEFEPFRSRKGDFNVNGVFRASGDSGPDEPRQLRFRRTELGASFDALGLNRYMLTEDNRAIRDLAGHVPYDSILIMVNSQRYGGGGIYNSYCIFSAGNEFSPYLMIHEFGHSFSGLADEYYSSSTSYNDFYTPGAEPSEPNITALTDAKNLKWKHLVKPNTPLPTPWEKEIYDKLEGKAKSDFLEKKEKEAAGTVGAYEGAGYVSTGFYRPMVNCIMFSRSIIPFCAVCSAHIGRVIDTYVAR